MLFVEEAEGFNQFSERINHEMCRCEERENSSWPPEALSGTGWKEGIYIPESINIAILNCVGLFASISEFRVGKNRWVRFLRSQGGVTNCMYSLELGTQV